MDEIKEIVAYRRKRLEFEINEEKWAIMLADKWLRMNIRWAM